MRRLLTSLTLLGLFTACSESVTGTVDGEPVRGARQSYYHIETYEVPFFGEFPLLVLLTSDVGGSCEVFDTLYSNVGSSCEETCEELAQASGDIPGGAHWNLLFSALLDEDIIGSYDMVGTELELVGFGAGFSTWNGGDLTDEATCEDQCEDGDGLFEGLSNPDDGELVLEEYTEDEALSGQFNLDFDGANALEGSFSAQPCSSLADLF
ncbi:MAG: hypothetical protein IPN01_24590 [Deltaproteobacteria bacterium]|nr:hypothetical protein [Deltaproteobacteria bacterium]